MSMDKDWLMCVILSTGLLKASFSEHSHGTKIFHSVCPFWEAHPHESFQTFLDTYLSTLFLPNLWSSNQTISSCLWVSHLSVQSGKLNTPFELLPMGNTFLYCCHSLSHYLLLHPSTLFLPVCGTPYEAVGVYWRRGRNTAWIIVKGAWATCPYILYLPYLCEPRFFYTFFPLITDYVKHTQTHGLVYQVPIYDRKLRLHGQIMLNG